MLLKIAPNHRTCRILHTCTTLIECKLCVWRSFGHQGALYYVFLASDTLKTSHEYAVFMLRTRGLKVCTRETSRQTQRVSALLFWLRQMIALLHTSRGKLAARTKFDYVLWKTKGSARTVTSKILCKRQKWGRGRPIYFCFVSFKSCIIRLKYIIAINNCWHLSHVHFWTASHDYLR